ncbi:filaggrin-2-like [Papio anubis]|uniref:filaggrin-2-like n=1 Tax=Papio anubis TaxID=9555 RepID=UPI0012AE435D|nr:filaggrin-2-like [Papio anubis]
MVMDIPHREGPGQLEEGDLATVSTVTVKGTQGSHTHIQDTLTAKLDLNMESQDPQVMGDRELLMDRQEIPLDMPTMVMDNPHREGPGQLEEGDLATVSTVIVKGTQGSHTHIQDTLMAKPDLNMESQNPQFTRDNKLLMDRQEISLNMATLVTDKPHRQGPGQLEEGDLATASIVIVNGTQGSHTHIQDTLMAKPDPNMESQDLPFMRDRELYMDRQEIPLDMASLVMESPHRQVPGQLEEGDLATVSTVTVKGTQVSHTHIQDILMAKPDPNMESQDLPFMGDKEPYMDRQEIPLDMASLVMDNPHRQGPGQLEEGDLATDPQVKGRQGTTHGHRQGDTTRHGQSGHGESIQTGSRTIGRRGSGHSEYSDSEGHSGVSHTHSGHTHGQAGSQHGESRSAVHGRQGTIHGQTGDTTRHGQSGHGQSTQRGSRTTGRRGSGHSEYSDGDGHSGGSHTHSGHTHGQAGSQRGESGSAVHGRQGTIHGQTGDTTRHGQSRHGESIQTSSRTIGRRGSGHSEYSDSEGHSGGSHTHSGHTHGQAGSQHGESGSVVHGRLETTHGQTGDTTRHGHSGYGQSTETGSRSTRTSHFQSHSSERQRHGSSHVWKHGSYGPAEYDYGYTGYGPSGGHRKSICSSHLSWSIDSATNEQLSRH